MSLQISAGSERQELAPVDWHQLKAEILSRLSVAEEYELLGVKFASPTISIKGWRDCHAVDREDAVESAAVNVQNWLYHDRGGEGKTINFFDFALKHGKWGTWIDVIRHYAEKAGVEVGTVTRSSRGSIEEEVYHYTKADGELSYGVFRYKMPNGKKDFRQYPYRNGEWDRRKGCMDNVQPLPYRLPDLLAADDDEPVLICEGEKDVDRAYSLDLVATTSHQGAGSTDRTWGAFARDLPRRDYYVVPDNDAGGRLHAQRVCAHLNPYARSIHWLKLPGLPPGGDLSDWLDLGGTVDELGQLMARSPLWTPETADEIEKADEEASKDEFDQDATAVDLIEANTTIKWIMPGWIPQGVLTAIAAEPGTGKCFGAGTPILMFDGTIKPVEEVAVGDLLMGPDSQPRTVLTLARGAEQMYRVTPVKGMSYVVNESHILSLKMTGLGKGSLAKHYASGQVVNISVRDYLASTKPFQAKAKGYRTGVDWDDQEVPLDPYFLGIWLGDGHKKSPSISKPDPEIEDFLRGYAESIGLQFSKRNGGHNCPVMSIIGYEYRAANPVYGALKSLGVVGRRHVPHCYKQNSRDVRLKVLAGLLDTDGHMIGSGFDFISMYQDLSEDVAFLARSVGLAAYVTECRKGCQTGAVGTYWRVSISGDCSVIPNLIARKKAPVRKQIKNVLMTGIKVEPIGEGEYFGFSVDKDHLFLLGDFTVAHNSRLCADLLKRIWNGLPWPDGSPNEIPKGSKAIWVAADNQHPELGSFPVEFDFDPSALVLNASRRNPFGGTMLDTVEDLIDFEKRIKRVQPVFVFVDTTANATDRNGNDAKDAKAFFKPLQEIAQRTQTAIVCVTHLNADGKPLGRRIQGQCRVVITMSCPDPEGQPNRRKLWVTKSNSLHPPALGVTMATGGNTYDFNPPEKPPEEGQGGGSGGKKAAPRVKECIAWLKEHIKGQRFVMVGDVRTAADQKGFDPKALYEAKRQLGLEDDTFGSRKVWRNPDVDENIDFEASF